MRRIATQTRNPKNLLRISIGLNNNEIQLDDKDKHQLFCEKTLH